MKTIRIIIRRTQLLFAIAVILCCNINTIHAQIGTRCSCEDIEKALKVAENILEYTESELKKNPKPSDIDMEQRREQLIWAKRKLAFAKSYVEVYEARLKSAKEGFEVVIKYTPPFSNEIPSEVSDPIIEAAWIIITELGYAGTVETLGVSVGAAAIFTAEMAVIPYIIANHMIPQLEEEYKKAEDLLNIKGDKDWARAYKNNFLAQEMVQKIQDELRRCKTFINVTNYYPRECQKCENGRIVANDNQYISSCKKCQKGKVVGDCPTGQQCCNGVCKPFEYEYIITETITFCENGKIASKTRTYTRNTLPSNYGATGKLEHSAGVCKGGSVVQISQVEEHRVVCP